MTETRIRLNIAGTIATVTLNRPHKLNAIDEEMLAELEAATRRLEQAGGVRVLLLTGEGDRAFSVGADIDAWSKLSPLEMWGRWIRDGHRVFERVARLRQPVIAAINGYAFGGGLELALAADLRVASHDAEFALPEAKIGTVPGWAGTRRLPRLVSTARAKRMVFTGSRIDASTAERWGLVDELAPSDVLLERVTALATEIASNAPASVQIAKQLIDGSDGEAVGTTLESLAGALTATTADGREGPNAFRERRPPRFIGFDDTELGSATRPSRGCTTEQELT